VLMATTDNPSFRLNTALLSRCRVFTLDKLSPEDCTKILQRALKLHLEQNPDSTVKIEPELIDFLAAAADGDARVALHTLEMAISSLEANPNISKTELKESLKRGLLKRLLTCADS
jgi:putative ATPase